MRLNLRIRSPFVRRPLTMLALLACVAAPGVQPLRAEEAKADAGLGRVASVQNQVETNPATGNYAPSLLNQALFERYRVRTGPSSRAGILYADQTLQRLNEKSEVEIQAPAGEKPGLISLLFGTHYFSSRAPKQFKRIETPAVTAAIRGTEFVVEVDQDTTTKITMIEGVVEASNQYGNLTVQSGEQAYVEPGKAPVKRIVVRPLDAVAWALYYPPILGGNDAKRLQALGPDGADLARAAEFLSAGQVSQARLLIEAVREKHPRDPVALALASVIAVTQGDKKEALRLAEEATAADPHSAAAALALSFAAQASFDIAKALDMAEKAAKEDPESSVALARAAELRMAEGDLEGAEQAAEHAVARTPDESRALAVLGFARLAQFRTGAALPFFEKAVAADPTSSLARLGLGLARIRSGKLVEGREEIQTAVLLDPDDSLLRSYLGKAYYEEKRPDEAAKELAAAKRLDPNDPTPYLYNAILEQNENRPAEALMDLRGSITRNDMRAVYRSKLLLDQDRAVRGADLARIYNDLGFNQLGLVTARRSADQDQANYSSHLFLSGNYRSLPQFAPAFFSEVLQSRIYQPVSVNAARPDVVNEGVSFNEYTALFDRPRARAFGGATYGRTKTDLDILVPADQLDDSDIRNGNFTGTLNGDHYAAALGYSKINNDGYRDNNDQAVANYRGFFEFAPTYRDSFQVNALVGRQNTGDLPLRFDTRVITSEHLTSELRNIGFGYHRVFSPGSDFVVSVIDNRTKQTSTFTDPFSFTKTEGEAVLEGRQAEVQHVFRREKITRILGAGGYRGTVILRPLSPPGSDLEDEDRFANAYGYLNVRPSRWFEATLGLAHEDVVSPTGLLTPRDFQIGQAKLEFTDSRFSPKIGVSFYPHPGTVLRAAYYERLNPAIGRIQTLEPTQVAGFNQLFSEPGGTLSRNYGVGVDQEFGSHLFGGVSAQRRRLSIPEAFCDTPDPFFGCFDFFSGTLPATHIEDRESHDDYATAYLNAVLGKRLAFSVDYLYQRRKFDVTMVNNNLVGFAPAFEDRIETQRVRPQLRWFLPNGLFASATGTYYDQEVDQRDAFDPAFATPDLCDVIDGCSNRFWIVDLGVGYKLPRRLGSIVIEGRNVGNREFEFFERSLEDTIIPARAVTLTLNFTL
jgi:tetratricopeptide (TPR) repeat protein